MSQKAPQSLNSALLLTIVVHYVGNKVPFGMEPLTENGMIPHVVIFHMTFHMLMFTYETMCFSHTRGCLPTNLTPLYVADHYCFFFSLRLSSNPIHSAPPTTLLSSSILSPFCQILLPPVSLPLRHYSSLSASSVPFPPGRLNLPLMLRGLVTHCLLTEQGPFPQKHLKAKFIVRTLISELFPRNYRY